jgi:copper chaperone CopZ
MALLRRSAPGWGLGFTITALAVALPAAAAPRATRSNASARLQRSQAGARAGRTPRPAPALKRMARSDQGLSAGARGPAGSSDVEKVSLEIPDLKTAENVAAVTGVLVGVRGVKSAIVDLNTCLAVVDYDPQVTELPVFLSACHKAGFPATEYRVENRFPKPIKLKGG